MQIPSTPFRLIRLRGAANSILLLAVLALFPGCEKQPGSSLSKEIQKIHKGGLEGYLAEGEVPNSLALLPPPPEERSAALALDQQMAAH